MTRTSKLAFASMLLAMLAFAGVAAAADPLAIFRQPGRTQRPPRVAGTSCSVFL